MNKFFSLLNVVKILILLTEDRSYITQTMFSSKCLKYTFSHAISCSSSFNGISKFNSQKNVRRI